MGRKEGSGEGKEVVEGAYEEGGIREGEGSFLHIGGTLTLLYWNQKER